MKYIFTKWGNLKYSSRCSDVIWKARILGGKIMKYNIFWWSDWEDFPKEEGEASPRFSFPPQKREKNSAAGAVAE